MPNAIMIALGKAKKPPTDESDEEMSEHDDISLDEDEKAAAKLAFDAKSPEEYGKALKAFVQLCSLNHEEYEEEE